MNNCKPPRIPQRLERLQRWMQTKKAIEIDRCFCAAVGFWDRYVWPEIVVRMFTVRHYYIQAVDRAALKDRDQGFATAASGAVDGFRQSTLQECRRRSHDTERRQCNAAGFDEV